MKLRIRDNSLRLRLTRSEVRELYETHLVESAIAFGPSSRLFYRLMASAEADAMSAIYSEHSVTVILPLSEAQQWASSEQIAMVGQQNIAEGRLSLLVEKDFACLKPRTNEHEDESDMYTNPNVGQGHC